MRGTETERGSCACTVRNVCFGRSVTLLFFQFQFQFQFFHCFSFPFPFHFHFPFPFPPPPPRANTHAPTMRTKFAVALCVCDVLHDLLSVLRGSFFCVYSLLFPCLHFAKRGKGGPEIKVKPHNRFCQDHILSRRKQSKTKINPLCCPSFCYFVTTSPPFPFSLFLF